MQAQDEEKEEVKVTMGSGAEGRPLETRPSKRYCWGLIHPDGLFNSPFTLIIFCIYVTLFVNNGILVTMSKKDGKYNYNTVAVVVIMECSKLVMAITIYSCQESFFTMVAEIRRYMKFFLYYMVPAFLYSLYNNLQFVNLGYYDPTTYYVLLQLRVVVTGVVYQIIFRRKLSVVQWCSLILLTIGCIIKHMKFDATAEDGKKAASMMDYHLSFILLQVFCSCLAGVYTEFLLKKDGGQVPVMVQNFFMYVDSILSNLIILFFSGGLKDLAKAEGYTALTQPLVIFVILNISLAGITTSMFLKYLNSIVKLFAASVEIVIVAVAARIIFGTSLNAQTIISIVLVCASLTIYSYAPVQNPPASQTGKSDREIHRV